MFKHVVAGFLWTFLALYAWSMYSGLAGIDFVVGPAIALGAVAVVLIARALGPSVADETVEASRPLHEEPMPLQQVAGVDHA